MPQTTEKNCINPLVSVVIPGIWKGALRAVLLDVHAKETNVHAVYFLECKKCFGSVREGLHHLARVHKPGEIETASKLQVLELNLNILYVLKKTGEKIISMVRSVMDVCLFYWI